MTRLSPQHPRYRSLRVRAALADSLRRGVVVPEGLIAHGRGEAFDYLLGERTTPSARAAERTAAQWLLAARRPVVSVNGNVAALDAGGIARLARARPGLAVEVNLFHRTPRRARAIARVLRAAGVSEVLGVVPTAHLPGLPSDRSRVDARGIAAADVCLVPLEDGDRAGALRALGKRVIAIDLNPLSRTARTADLPIVDELSRALLHIAEELERRSAAGRGTERFRAFDGPAALRAALKTMAQGWGRPAPVPASPRPSRGSGRRSRRTP
jgi:4-phosphopantoate---beta-alanine ligase